MKEKKDLTEEKLDQALLRFAENAIRIGSLERLLMEKGVISEQELVATNNKNIEKFFSILNQEVQVQQEPEVKSE